MYVRAGKVYIKMLWPLLLTLLTRYSANSTSAQVLVQTYDQLLFNAALEIIFLRVL